MKKLVLASSVVFSAGAAFAAGTYQAGNQTYTYDVFKPVMLDVTVATEKSTGHRMALARMKNGHMMALVPADLVMGLMVPVPKDMF